MQDVLQAELEQKERKHFRTKGGSDFEGTKFAQTGSQHALVECF